MISHSLITIAWMLSGFFWCLVLRLGPSTGAAFVSGWTGFIIGVWYSREEMQEEYHLDRVGGANLETLMPFLWDKWNQDFVVPVAIALAMAAAFVLWRHRSGLATSRRRHQRAASGGRRTRDPRGGSGSDKRSIL